MVRLRLRRALRNPRELDEARRQMAFLLDCSGQPADIEAVARRYVERMTWRAELRYHPEMITRQPVTGLEHVNGRRGPTGGLIINFMHHGQFDGAFGSLVRAGVRPMKIACHPAMFDPDGSDWILQHCRVSALGGEPFDVSVKGYADMIGMLKDGEIVAIATDVPGRTPLTFAGRRLLGSSGAARLALETNTPVVCVTAHPTPKGPRLELSAPLLPEDFGSPGELLNAIVAHHEGPVLAWPEASDWPRRRWTLLDAEGDPLADTVGPVI